MAELTPLEVVLEIMRELLKQKDYAGAVAAAKVAAPYLHGRAPVARPGGVIEEVSDEELERYEREGGAGASSGDPEPFG